MTAVITLFALFEVPTLVHPDTSAKVSYLLLFFNKMLQVLGLLWLSTLRSFPQPSPDTPPLLGDL